MIVLDLARTDVIGQVTGWHPAPSRPLPSFRDDRSQPRPIPRMIEFRVLGPVEAVRDGNAVASGGRASACCSHSCSSVLRGRLRWIGSPTSCGTESRPDGAPTTIRAYVSKLRAVLGADAAITSSTAGYALDVGGDAVDANRFERLAREGHEALERGATRRAATRLAQALELWSGHPFAGLNDEGALRLEAQRLEDLRLSAFEDRIEADLSLGKDAQLIDELEGLVGEFPYRERLWRQLMLAMYRAERQADALAAYRRARAVLDEELGLEPGEELQRLEQAILRHEVPPAPTAGGTAQPSRRRLQLRRSRARGSPRWIGS